MNPSAAHFDLITVGDATIDTFIKVHDATVQFNINHEECKICFEYGGKIPVDAIEYGVAGNAANVAVGAVKLGLPCAIYTNLGNDNQGKMIYKALESGGVCMDFVKTTTGKKSNLSVVLTFSGERTIFVYHQDWDYKLPEVGNVKWIYLTSMAKSFENSDIMEETLTLARKTGAKLVYSPGTYQLKAGIGKYPKILENCEAMIINQEEAKRILEFDLEEKLEPSFLLSKLLLLGPKIVVVTDGEEGSVASDGNRNLRVGVYPTKVVERTGAGDAYACAFVAALFDGEDLGEAMVWGAINSSHAISQIGAQRGLLSKEELIRTRKVVPELKAVEF